MHWELNRGDGSGPTARGGCACTTLGGSVVLFGGADRMAHVFSDVWLLEAGAEGYRWRPAPCSAEKGYAAAPVECPSPPSPRVKPFPWMMRG
mmetsp:Transcript_28481/g.67839  ORF Transcript_28481/g.67839 Transcript_28481/m.67839 type:complete len:92 (+) Transcript_28481:109-384(+)